MKTIMTICFKSVKHKLTHAIGYFELLGFDFMLDADFNVRLKYSNFHTNKFVCVLDLVD